MPIGFIELSFGELRRDASGRYQARLIGLANVDGMSTEARRYLAAHLEDLIARSEEYGHAQAGWWAQSGQPEEVAALLPGSGVNFEPASGAALERLTTATPGTASPGLIAIVRFTEPRPFLAVLKLDIEEEDLYRFASQAQAEGVIEYQHLDDVLPSSSGELKKAALIPNPSSIDADLRVVDDEAQEGTATYWLNFLGAMVYPPAPKVLKAVVELTKEVLLEQVDRSVVQQAMGRNLQAIADSPDPVPARTFVERTAVECQLEADRIWNDVRSRAGIRLPESAAIPPQAIDRLYTEISFRAGGQLITVRGPSEALEGRYSWEATSTGYVLTLRTDDAPRVKMVSKPGRLSVG